MEKQATRFVTAHPNTYQHKIVNSWSKSAFKYKWSKQSGDGGREIPLKHYLTLAIQKILLTVQKTRIQTNTWNKSEKWQSKLKQDLLVLDLELLKFLELLKHITETILGNWSQGQRYLK